LAWSTNSAWLDVFETLDVRFRAVCAQALGLRRGSVA